MKMKFTKKIATILLSVCLIVPCFSVMALAANGVIFFSDLETSVGDEFTITGTAVVSGDVIGDATIHMTYDPSYMRFEEGDGVNADTDGNLTFKGSGDGSSDRIEFTMKFQALQEGSTRLEQGDATVTDSAGSSVACEEGYADVTIGAGDPSKIKDVANGASVTIDGQEYTLSGDFSDSMIPAGFTAGEITYNDDNENDNSVGIRMTYGDTSFLIYGDGEEAGEQAMIASGEELSSDVLMVSHHGSRNATTKEILEAVKPSYAVISVGADNSYGHPTEEVLDRLANAGCTVYRTDLNGTIQAYSDGKTITFIPERQSDMSGVGENQNLSDDTTKTDNVTRESTTEKVQTEIEAGSEKAAEHTYIINTNTGKFHEPSCRSVKRMNDSNKKEYIGSRDDLITQGYEPCKICNP